MSNNALGICHESSTIFRTFKQFKTFEQNFRQTYELQELTTDCAIQLRSSRTEYVSATNPNTGILWDSGPVWNRGIKKKEVIMVILQQNNHMLYDRSKRIQLSLSLTWSKWRSNVCSENAEEELLETWLIHRLFLQM